MSNTNEVKIESSWGKALKDEFSKPYFSKLKNFLKSEKELGKIIYPPGNQIFRCFELTPFDEVKIVLLGQDPYINDNQAHGLSFSVPMETPVPESLKNIYRELNKDLGIPIAKHGNLEKWAKQGVLLMNSILTVERKKSGSHARKGWESFTDAAIQSISTHRENIVFLLWGNYAKNKSGLIDMNKHLILTAAHPSPLAGGAFFGNRHFSKAKNYMESKGIIPISWDLNQ